MTTHHFKADIYSSDELVEELHNYFKINSTHEKMVVKLTPEKQTKKTNTTPNTKKKSQPHKPKYEDLDMPISIEMMEELKQLREQHRQAFQNHSSKRTK